MKKIFFIAILFALLASNNLFSQKVQTEINGFKLGDSPEQVIKRAKELNLKQDTIFKEKGWLMFRAGSLFNLKTDLWTVTFFDNKCCRIECNMAKSDSNYTSFYALKKIFLKKYNKPKINSDLEFNKILMWKLKDNVNKGDCSLDLRLDLGVDKSEVTNRITLINNTEFHKFNEKQKK